MKQSAVISILVAASMILLVSCAGTSDEVVTGTRASARIYEADGRNPAVGVTVKIFEADASDGSSVSQQTTSASGVYSLNDLPQGTYNVWAQRDSLVCFQNDVSVTEDGVAVRDDTLECASSVTGIVGVQPQDDPQTVTIQVVGLDKYFRNTDKDGFFTMHNMAQGSYSLLLKCTQPNYTPTIANVKVGACMQDTLKDTLRLTFTGIPIVLGLSASYDTAAGAVRLCWKATDYRSFQSYCIFRDFFDSAAYSVSPVAATGDTCFFDTIFRVGSVAGRFSAADTNDYHFRYRVAIRDNVSAIGPTFKYVDVVAASPSKVRTFFEFSGRHTARNIVFAPFRDIPAFGTAVLTAAASVNDTIVITVRCVNATRLLTGLSWNTDSGGVIRSIKPASAVRSIVDSVRCVWSTTGVHRVVCTVTDNAGSARHDTTRIAVVTDAPAAGLSIGDTLVAVDTVTDRYWFASGDTVPLHLDATDRFGSIVAIRWGLGASVDPALPGMISDTFVIAPDTAVSNFPVMVSVSDDDGNSAADSLDISVGLFGLATPRAAFAPRMYQGAIVFDGKMWIFGGVGIVQETPRSTTAKSLTDVWNSTDGRIWTQVAGNAPARSGHAMLEFGGKLWLIGGYSGSWGTYKNDVWCSADGISWTCITDSAPFSPRIHHAAAVFGGRMLVLGGVAKTSHVNDVWSSTDGIAWERASDSAAFPARCAHTCMIFRDKLWVIGGRDSGYLPLNDVWCSSDGATWIRVVDEADFSPRHGHSGVVWNNRMWIVGGCGFGSSDMAGDVWYSEDGAIWKEANDPGGCAARAFPSSLFFGNRMWIIAGQRGNTVLAGDVWRSGIFVK